MVSQIYFYCRYSFLYFSPVFHVVFIPFVYNNSSSYFCSLFFTLCSSCSYLLTFFLTWMVDVCNVFSIVNQSFWKTSSFLLQDLQYSSYLNPLPIFLSKVVFVFLSLMCPFLMKYGVAGPISQHPFRRIQ